MGQPAARIGDMHTCPIHAGGPVLTGQVNVLIGGMPAARITDKALCVNSPPDVIIEGEPTVLVAATRLAHRRQDGAWRHDRGGVLERIDWKGERTMPAFCRPISSHVPIPGWK